MGWPTPPPETLGKCGIGNFVTNSWPNYLVRSELCPYIWAINEQQHPTTMSTLTTILNETKANGNNYIYATCDSDANNGIEWCVRNGYVTKTREEAEAAIMAEYAQMNPVAHANGSTPSSMWIWSIEEEIANA